MHSTVYYFSLHFHLKNIERSFVIILSGASMDIDVGDMFDQLISIVINEYVNLVIDFIAEWIQHTLNHIRPPFYFFFYTGPIFLRWPLYFSWKFPIYPEFFSISSDRTYLVSTAD